ncbi:MAG: ATP-dependent Clp protease ATP-binding subunit ClpX, partial [Lachnospiraceae bacterium]|nr:ATP-dependent Clp protease ATP-binding subunit ClpX [Lachnospiraceae bacterium]
KNGFPNISFVNLADLQGDGGIPNKQKLKRKKKGEEARPVIDIKNVPAPHKIKASLDEYVVGQEYAKKVISVAVYNHYKRVATNTMDEIEIEKSNMLMIGPTGCGKTYLVKTLARLLDVPLAIADATSLTEAGYIGDDIESVVSKLLAAADNDVERAEQGIIFMDEIDKSAKKKETRSRDVSGESVQQGMLKLLEGAEVEVPVGANSKNAMVPLATVNTRNILFICGAAFPDLEEIIKERLTKTASIGFGAELKDKYDKDKNILSKVTVEDIRKFGMIPEFIGRLPVIYTLEGLSKEMMVKILKEPKNAILKQYQKLLELDEVKLEFTDGALEAIADKAMERDTGARALRSIIEEFMLDIMYEIPKDDNIGKVTITREYIEGSGGPLIEIRGDIKRITEKTAGQEIR